MARLKKDQQGFDVWPGFVDAISTLLLLFVFMMALFSVISFSLGQSLSGKNEEISTLETELTDAEQQVDEFGNIVKKYENQVGAYETQVTGLSADLQKAKAEQEKLLQQLGELIGLRQEESIYNQEQTSSLNAQIVALEATRQKLLGDITNIKLQQQTALQEAQDEAAQAKLSEEELNARIAALTQEVSDKDSQLTVKSQAQIDAEAEMIALREQIGTLSTSLQNVENALALRDETIEDQKIEISDLGNRINEALASEVNQLQKYRSEFFGELRQALGNNDDIKIEGDRFVISSGVLFNSASADLGAEGVQSVDRLADIIKTIEQKIPDDIDWIIRVDGHTDKRPYSGTQFADNWALSNARALSVVQQLIADGVPPSRLVAAGFGEFHPINNGNSPQDLAQNRRIEIKLTQK